MPETSQLAVIAPCLNEAPNIDALAARVTAALTGRVPSFELILVDDGSTDETWERIETLAAADSRVRGVRHNRNRGIVESWRSGLMATEAPRVVTIDADLQYRPEDIPMLMDAMEREGADFVQGWRRTQVNRSALRTFLTGGLSGLLNLVFGMRLRDNKSGFVLYRREALAEILDFRRPYRYFQHFIAVAAHGLGYRITQVPIDFDQRVAGTSFIKAPIRFALIAAGDIPRAIWDYRLFPRRRRIGTDR